MENLPDGRAEGAIAPPDLQAMTLAGNTPWFGSIAIAISLLTIPMLIGVSLWAGQGRALLPAMAHAQPGPRTADASGSQSKNIIPAARLRLTGI